MSSTNSNQGIILAAVSWIFFVFALLVCCIRLYVDFLILPSPARLDTYIASFTFVSALKSPSRPANNRPQLAAITSQVFTTLSVYCGMGQHLKSLDPMQIMYSLKWSWMAQILQLFANTTGKVAVITYLTKFLGPSHAKAKLAYLWTLGSLQIASIVVLIAFILTQCSPLQKLWNEAIPCTCNGRFRNQNFAFFQGSKRWSIWVRAKQVMLMRSRSLRFHRCMPCGVPDGDLLATANENRKESPALCTFRIWSAVS